jgi:hypothetical protein
MIIAGSKPSTKKVMLYLFKNPNAKVIAASHNHLLLSELMNLMT